MTHYNIFPQINRKDSREDNGEEDWWELWDRKRRMAVVQVLCYAVFAIYMAHVYYQTQCDEPAATAGAGKKRKVRLWERELGSIAESIHNVAEAIREGNVIIKRVTRHVYSEAEVFAELLRIGIEQHLRYKAYSFLTSDPARVRALLGCPVDERKDLLRQMMYGPEDP
uniref:Uncharacterized protein MANES_03G183000 n=1 Tax=Rhizophora mucronata TaxID=61149 RepID=A0A2P2MZ03_RHIMU